MNQFSFQKYRFILYEITLVRDLSKLHFFKGILIIFRKVLNCFTIIATISKSGGDYKMTFLSKLMY